ncbi:DUF6090 family protein [Geojedonia litorea]|uniref:DUF6090 family protein n=1 Tax=Geojedonia litorea TaxID=1268269 RepID=A0ABV9N1J7_9FLAO
MENKTSKYIKYAIGEIVLVVIGILIALSINNWNNQRSEANKMRTYYEKLLNELETKIVYNENLIKGNHNLEQMLRQVLEILNSKNQANSHELAKNLGAIATSWSSEYSFEIFNEFVTQGMLSKVKDENLKQAFTRLNKRLSNSQNMDDFIQDQYSNIIEPYLTKYLNYSKIALPAYKQMLVEGGPEIDYDSLFNSLELWNIVTLKLETTAITIHGLESMQKLLIELKSILSETLDHND